jgi:hypothetical protein
MRLFGSLALVAVLIPVGCGSSGRHDAARGAIRYGQIAASARRPALDVWQIGSSGEVILQWHGDNTESTSFDPAKRRVTIIDGGAISSVDDYPTNADAWAREVGTAYGVSRAEVASALAAGPPNACALRVASVARPTLIRAHFPACRPAAAP